MSGGGDLDRWAAHTVRKTLIGDADRKMSVFRKGIGVSAKLEIVHREIHDRIARQARRDTGDGQMGGSPNTDVTMCDGQPL